MQTTSDLYKSIFISKNHYAEYKLVIGGVTYNDDVIISLNTTAALFDSMSVGNAVSGEINIEMIAESENIPRMAEIKPYVRLSDGARTSEWIQKGVYFIDTRETNVVTNVLKIHGYDAMLKGEQFFHGISFPRRDYLLIEDIADAMGVDIDSRTYDIMTKNYNVNPGTGENALTIRETLGYMGAMYAGNWVISDTGELRLVQLNSLPDYQLVLGTELGLAIDFGGVVINA